VTGEQLLVHRHGVVCEARQRFVPQVVRVKVDSFQDVSIGDPLPTSVARRFDVVREQEKRFPG
jgi:hypothetical protein